MARNEEKSQSMLFRFREAQAASLGLVGRTDRRPRVASSCKDLRQCERWRGEILRDISRKVSKIQDFGLTDYEVRDLNDEINKLLREKHHWENQIVSLGGANYKRALGKGDNQGGSSAPGSRGYKYFGRAKELPGVKELFERSAPDASDTQVRQRRDNFGGQPPSYYGDEDEQDGDLLAYEKEAELEAWEDALDELRDADIDLPDPAPPLPVAQFVSLTPSDRAPAPAPAPAPDAPAEDTPAEGGKRKAAPAKTPKGKKAKLDAAAAAAAEIAAETAMEVEEAAPAPGAFLSVLRAEDLRAPTLITAEEMEKYIVRERKKALLAEYDA